MTRDDRNPLNKPPAEINPPCQPGTKFTLSCQSRPIWRFFLLLCIPAGNFEQPLNLSAFPER